MMEEKKDQAAENELPLFDSRSDEDTPQPEPAAPVVQDAPAAPAEEFCPEVAPVETPVETPVSAGSRSSGAKIPPGLRPGASFGSFLRQAREFNGLTLDDLARITRIKRGYLEAVEQENYQDLPAVVYALAYINTLADYYGVDAEGKALLTSEVRKHLEYEAPEENKTVVGYEPSAENQILLRRILMAGAGMIVLLAVLITLAVLFFTSGGSEAPAGSAGTVSGGAPAGPGEGHLVELQPAPVLQTHVLPVPSASPKR